MQKCVFLGSRVHVFNAAIQMGVTFAKIYALKGSFLEKQLLESGINYSAFELKDKNLVLQELFEMDFNILISNGCPILFPVAKFRDDQILINIHPTYLPHLQGKTPLNGVFFLDYDFYGATMHFIDKGVDTGNVIFQKKVELTPDIDLGLLYHLALALEGDVFKSGWQLLLDHNFSYNGVAQTKEGGTYFNRTDAKRTLDFTEHGTDEILRRIKSFGLLTQGAVTNLEGNGFLIFEAENIVHQPLLDQNKHLQPGTIALSYDDKILVKTIDGLIKVTRYKKQNLKK